MSVIAHVSMNLDTCESAEACDAVNEILRGEQRAFRQDSPLIDYRFDPPEIAKGERWARAEVAMYLDVSVQELSAVDQVIEIENVVHGLLLWQEQSMTSDSCLLGYAVTGAQDAPEVAADYEEGDVFHQFVGEAEA